MEIGEEWAYRESAHALDCPVVPARILQFGPPKSNKVRVCMLGGEYAGLEMWIPRIRLLVPWRDAEAWLRDERLFAAAAEASMAQHGSLEYEAAMVVADAYPQPGDIQISYGRKGGATVRVRDLAAVARDLGLREADLVSEPLGFVDRHGEYVGPWSVAYRLVRRVAEIYGDQVLAKVAAEESKLQEGTIRGYTIHTTRGEATFIPPELSKEFLRRRQPIFNLVRSWCGEPVIARFDEIEALQREVARLRGLVEQAASWLEEADRPKPARRLRKDLNSEP